MNRLRKGKLSAFTTLILVSIVLFTLLSAFPTHAEFINANEARIKAVAVKSTEPPEGAVINISVIVTPGNGKVFVSTIPYTQIDMQGSAQLAALTACDILGLDFMKYDFFFTIEADSPIVGGPSAGGVMTVATISALKNLSLRSDVYMTGMIYPDGFIGPVGGIPYKLKAAADNGAKIFLIPKGQRVVMVEETVEEKRGPFIFISKKSKPVDLYEYGKKLGVKVIEVEKIEDALLYYTNYTLVKSQPAMNFSRYSNLLLQLADRMKRDTSDLYSTVKATGAKLDKADEFISKGDESYRKGFYYTATSQYFTAKIELRYLYYTHTIKNDMALENEFESVEKEINSTKNFLSSQKELGIESFQLFGAAQERITLAEDYLYQARTSDDFDKSLRYLALAKERIESAKVWLSLLQTINEDIPIKTEDLKRRAQFYLSQAESMAVYASQIGGYPQLIDEAEKSIEISRKQLEEGFYAGSAVSAIDGITKASLSIELINTGEELLNSKVASANNSARIAIGEVEKFVTPVLPVAYLEYADTAENPVVKLSYYKLSERLAKLMLSLSRAFPESMLVKVELNYPAEQPKATATPASSPLPDLSRIKPSVPKLPEIEKYLPGFEIYLAIIVLLTTAYLAGRIRAR
ncbi:MAG: serine protease-like protein [Archaeoglobus sp.]|nr:serine protease-like protein [Archaeoglobus sp.]